MHCIDCMEGRNPTRWHACRDWIGAWYACNIVVLVVACAVLSNGEGTYALWKWANISVEDVIATYVDLSYSLTHTHTFLAQIHPHTHIHPHSRVMLIRKVRDGKGKEGNEGERKGNERKVREWKVREGKERERKEREGNKREGNG